VVIEIPFPDLSVHALTLEPLRDIVARSVASSHNARPGILVGVKDGLYAVIGIYF
jgi:hypothetical protein